MKSWKSLIVAISLGVAGLQLSVYAQSETSCPLVAVDCGRFIGEPPPIEKEYDGYNAVFTGLVTDIQRISLTNGFYLNAVRFEVGERFMNELGSDIEVVITGGCSNFTQYQFRIGSSYLVWATTDKNGIFGRNTDGDVPYVVDYCSRTALLQSEGAQKDLDWLRALPECGNAPFSQACRESN